MATIDQGIQAEALAPKFSEFAKDGKVHNYQTNTPVNVTLANGDKAQLSNISLVDKNANDAFFAPGENYKAQGIVNRKDTEFSVGKKPLVPGAAEKMDVDESTGFLRPNSKDDTFTFPKGSFGTDADGNRVDLSGAKMDVPEGTDVVQMVELDDGSTIIVPLDLDGLNKVDGETFTDTKKNGDVKREYTEKTYEDTDGKLRKQYEDAGVPADKIDKLTEEAIEVHTRLEKPTLKDKGLDAAADAIDKAVDGIKNGNIPEVPGIKN